MNRELLTYLFRFVLLIAVQVLVLNNIQFSGIINPFLYIYFLLVLPVDFQPNAGLIIGFILGLIIDVFSQTLGMHTIATLFCAYARPYILKYMAPRDGYEFTRNLSLKQMGWLWFGTYAGILVFLHHFILFFVESFKMSGLGYTFLKAGASGVITMSLIFIVQLLFSSRNKTSAGYE